MEGLVVSGFDPGDPVVEIVERKGLGHPDTICDALAENFSRNLCREYRARCGEIAGIGPILVIVKKNGCIRECEARSCPRPRR